MMVAATIEWPALVFDQSFMQSVDKLALRRFGEGALAEEATTYVVDYLSADDWDKCKAFEGKSQPRTFLYTLSNNAIEEFSRKRFGRPRPPVWLQELGDLWIKLWRSLCLERQMLPAIVDRFCHTDFREPANVHDAARVIKARIPNCGQSSRDDMAVEDIDQISDAEQSSQLNSGCCDEIPMEFDTPFHGELLMMIRAIASPDTPADHFSQQSAQHHDGIAHKYQHQLEQLRSALSMTDQEIIMLRMIYVEGLSKTATSKAMGLPAHQAGRIVKDVLDRIGDALRQCDLDLDSLLDIV